jgi:hypothetical protein
MTRRLLHLQFRIFTASEARATKMCNRLSFCSQGGKITEQPPKRVYKW